ncbi:RebB family R body protein [Nannocystaceae bacterium ST9]
MATSNTKESTTSPSDDGGARTTSSPSATTSLAVTGVAPALAMGTLYQTTTQAVGLSQQNAVAAQNLQYSISNAAAVEAIGVLHGVRNQPSADDRLETTLARVVRVLDALSPDKQTPKSPKS